MCSFQSKNFQYLSALMFVVEEISRNHYLLPNITVGFDLYNVMPSNVRMLENSLVWLSGTNTSIPTYSCRRRAKAAVFLSETGISIQKRMLLELYRIPEVRVPGKQRKQNPFHCDALFRTTDAVGWGTHPGHIGCSEQECAGSPGSSQAAQS